jgi:hypothetical protein
VPAVKTASFYWVDKIVIPTPKMVRLRNPKMRCRLVGEYKTSIIADLGRSSGAFEDDYFGMWVAQARLK